MSEELELHTPVDANTAPETFKEWVSSGMCAHFLCFVFTTFLKQGLSPEDAFVAAKKKVVS